MDKPLRVLIAEDSEDDVLLIMHELRRGNYDPVFERVDTEEAMKAALTKQAWDIVISDHTMPQFNSFAALQILQKTGLDLPFIIVSGKIGEEMAVAAMKAGASDYIIKSNMARLAPVVDRELWDVEERAEKRRTEELLQQEKGRAQNYLDIAGVMLVALDADQKVTLINRRGREILGYEEEEIIGKRWVNNFLPERHRERLEDVFAKLTTADIEPVEYLENPVLTKSGEERIIAWHNTVLRDETGNIIGTLSSGEDITGRKQAEAALCRTEEKFRELYDHAPVGYHEYDGEGRITNVNRTDLEMLGYTADEMIGQPVWMFNVEEEEARERILAKLAGTLPPSRNLERTYIRKDGSAFPALCQDRLILDEKGGIKGIRCAIQDITERKRAEIEKASLQDQLRQSQKMEAIGRLAGGIAHDFNNLLTVIQGYSQLSLMGLEDGFLKESLLEVKEAAERAANLTRQLLAFGRRQIMEVKVVDINQIVKNLEKMLRRVIGEDIELFTILHKDIGQVKVDPGQLEQVLLNLVVNARDAMPDGGKIIIETTAVTLDETYASSHVAVKPGPYVMVAVTDTGVGMTQEVRERVFEPFFTTKEKEKGTGLGLSTVYGIVKQSNGNIWVYSEPGRGTTVKTYLPGVNEATEDWVRKSEEGVVSGRGETILVVEDEETVRRVTVKLLTRQGYRVFEARRWEEAIAICEEKEEPIHLILTDVVMPEMDGPQLMERLKKIRRDFKVIYMSGYTDGAISRLGILEKEIFFLQKPFTNESLLGKVREALDG